MLTAERNSELFCVRAHFLRSRQMDLALPFDYASTVTATSPVAGGPQDTTYENRERQKRTPTGACLLHKPCQSPEVTPQTRSLLKIAKTT